jgi:FKBP-type peptidyl-prolyl cis-trans isomerase (trigger factor)
MKYENIKVTKTENSEIEVTGEIAVSSLPEYRKKALKEIGENITIQGFRKGHIPEKVLVEKLGKVYILEESAELALKDIVPEIIEKEAPNYIGRPQISITKLAPENPIGFKIVVGVMPEVKLPDYKKIAKKEMGVADEKVEVTEKEIDDVIEQVRKQEAHRAFHSANSGEQNHNHSEDAIKEHMPEVNDEFVKKLGDFKDVADFKVKAKENARKEKEYRAKEKKRGKMLETLITETDLKLPSALIENEINRMFAQFEGDIANMGLKVDDYLKHIKKTREELIKDWRPDAEKRAKLNVILETIAKEEKLKPNEEAVKIEVENLTRGYKDVDPVRAQMYVEHMFTLEEAIKFLESQNK